MPWPLVIAGCIGMFAATATGSTRAPFLPDMAAELDVSLPAVANLFAVTAGSWGVASYVVGYASDRVGRTLFLIGSPICIAIAMFVASRVQTYGELVAIVSVAGVCCGAYTATMLAEVSIRTPPAYQGRAFGYVMTGQSLTLLFGIPLSAWLGAKVGWRGVHVALGGLALVSVMTMVGTMNLRSSIDAASTHKKRSKTALRNALTGPIVRLFLALIAERLCFGLAAFYYASYLRTAYELPIESVAVPLVIFAVGNILGTIVGGQVADRFAYRRISFAVAIILAGCVSVPWFAWQPGLPITVTLGSLFAFTAALARPPLLAALADVPADVRGAVMGLNSAVASIGWLIAALVGGWLYAGTGFVGFSPLMALMCVMAAALVVPDSRMRQRYTH